MVLSLFFTAVIGMMLFTVLAMILIKEYDEDNCEDKPFVIYERRSYFSISGESDWDDIEFAMFKTKIEAEEALHKLDGSNVKYTKYGEKYTGVEYLIFKENETDETGL